VSEPASISLGIAGRYAQALFELAREGNALSALEADADALGAALAVSPELGEMIASPVISREDQAAAMAAVAKKLGVSALTANTIALMAGKRRLFVLPQLVADLKARIAAEKGEVTADVTAPVALTPAQAEALAAALKSKGGKIVKLDTTMIDTSVKAKLASLQNAMKEVG